MGRLVRPVADVSPVSGARELGGGAGSTRTHTTHHSALSHGKAHTCVGGGLLLLLLPELAFSENCVSNAAIDVPPPARRRRSEPVGGRRSEPGPVTDAEPVSEVTYTYILIYL